MTEPSVRALGALEHVERVAEIQLVLEPRDQQAGDRTPADIADER